MYVFLRVSFNDDRIQLKARLLVSSQSYVDFALDLFWFCFLANDHFLLMSPPFSCCLILRVSAFKMSAWVLFRWKGLNFSWRIFRLCRQRAFLWFDFLCCSLGGGWQFLVADRRQFHGLIDPALACHVQFCFSSLCPFFVFNWFEQMVKSKLQSLSEMDKKPTNFGKPNHQKRKESQCCELF